MSLNFRQICRNTVVATALIGVTAPVASKWRAVSVRPDDNASRILDANGVSARTLAALLEQPEIASRLRLVHVGDTIELFVVDGELKRLRLFDGSRIGLGARVTSAGEWRTRTINLNDYGAIAARIRQLEAGEGRVIGNRSPTERPQVVLVTSPPPPVESPPKEFSSTERVPPGASIAAHIRGLEQSIDGRIGDSRRPQSAAKTERVATTVTPPEKDTEAKRAVAPLAKAKTHQSTTLAEVTTKAKPPKAAPAKALAEVAKPPPKAPTLATSPTKATPKPAASTAIAAVKPTSPALPKTTNPAGKPSRAQAIQQVVSAPSCPSIEGRWQAHYATFECDAEVLFARKSGDAFKMKQKGCGGIAGIVEQDDRKLLGQWKHTLCKGELQVELDSSCKKGSGTWKAAPGQRLCQAKPYPVTITRLEVAKTITPSGSSSWSEDDSNDR